MEERPYKKSIENSKDKKSIRQDMIDKYSNTFLVYDDRLWPRDVSDEIVYDFYKNDVKVGLKIQIENEDEPYIVIETRDYDDCIREVILEKLSNNRERKLNELLNDKDKPKILKNKKQR